MTVSARYIPYSRTGAFPPTLTGYLEKGNLKSFYNYEPAAGSVEKAIAGRRGFPCDRNFLVNHFKSCYSGIQLHPEVMANIDALQSENTFTVCTAHQPNIFTGHLYFVYKILHAIRLAKELNVSFADHRFVPVYFMGSEDADLEELGAVVHEGKSFRWDTDQSGAIGRMKVDNKLPELTDAFADSFSGLPEAAEVLAMLRRHYAEGETIERATLGLVNELFGKYGLLIFLPDRPGVKRAFLPVIREEILHAVSLHSLEKPVSALSRDYRIAAIPRDTNLFYFSDKGRERIDRIKDGFILHPSKQRFSADELIAVAEEHPERFSPNVILRPVLQEMMLPDIAFIGGGSEISYWLQLKELFGALQIHFPMLIPRNSFMLVTAEQNMILNGLGLQAESVFTSAAALEKEFVLSRSAPEKRSLDEKLQELDMMYKNVLNAAMEQSPGMESHIMALRAKAAKSFRKEEKHRIRLLKKSMRSELQELASVCDRLTPGGRLQERVDNFMPWLARYGFSLTDQLLQAGTGFGGQFCILFPR